MKDDFVCIQSANGWSIMYWNCFKPVYFIFSCPLFPLIYNKPVVIPASILNMIPNSIINMNFLSSYLVMFGSSDISYLNHQIALKFYMHHTAMLRRCLSNTNDRTLVNTKLAAVISFDDTSYQMLKRLLVTKTLQNNYNILSHYTLR